MIGYVMIAIMVDALTVYAFIRGTEWPVASIAGGLVGNISVMAVFLRRVDPRLRPYPSLLFVVNSLLMAATAFGYAIYRTIALAN